MSQLSRFLSHHFPLITGSHRLTRELERRSSVTAVLNPVRGLDFTYSFTKSGRRIVVTCDKSALGLNRSLSWILFSRLSAAFCCFAQTHKRIQECRGDVSDGGENCPNMLSFCSSDPKAILIPDADFFRSNGYQDLRHFILANNRPWTERQNSVLWRGSTTGFGKIAAHEMNWRTAEVIQRTRMCLLLNGERGVDAKLSSVVQSNSALDECLLREAAILGDPIPAEKWLNFRFAIDVDGNTNAWSNFFQRFLLGCCVLKVASPRNFQQWYYKDLKPWVHFVPVKADLSDLKEMVGWCLANSAECERIAGTGAALVWKMTLETEMARGVVNIEAALSSG